MNVSDLINIYQYKSFMEEEKGVSLGPVSQWKYAMLSSKKGAQISLA